MLQFLKKQESCTTKFYYWSDSLFFSINAFNSALKFSLWGIFLSKYQLKSLFWTKNIFKHITKQLNDNIIILWYIILNNMNYKLLWPIGGLWIFWTPKNFIYVYIVIKSQNQYFCFLETGLIKPVTGWGRRERFSRLRALHQDVA